MVETCSKRFYLLWFPRFYPRQRELRRTYIHVSMRCLYVDQICAANILCEIIYTIFILLIRIFLITSVELSVYPIACNRPKDEQTRLNSSAFFQFRKSNLLFQNLIGQSLKYWNRIGAALVIYYSILYGNRTRVVS